MLIFRKTKRILSKVSFVSLLAALFFCVSEINVFAEQIRLLNGDRIHGTIQSEDEQSVTVLSESFGVLKIPKASVRRITRPGRLSNIQKSLETTKNEVSPWTRKVSLGYTGKSGNTDSNELHAEASVERKTEKTDFTLGGYLDYGQIGEVLNTQQWLIGSRFGVNIWEAQQERLDKEFWDYLKAVRIENIYKIDLDHDKFADIDYRIIPTIGLAYWLADEEDWKFRLESGLGVVRTEYISNKSATTDPTIIPSVYVEKRLWGQSRISELLTFYPSFNDITRDYRYVSVSKLTNPLTAGLSLDLSLTYEYNHTSGLTSERGDLTFVTALTYTF